MKFGKKLFPLTLLPLMMLGAGGAAEANTTKIPADSPKIQYFGRWHADGGVYASNWGATYITAIFTGTSLYADLSENPNVWWRVSIDGGAYRRFKAQGENTLLAENLEPGSHTMRLVRSTEGGGGIAEFRGFALDEYHSLLKPVIKLERRLEFVGDSITAGAMNDGTYWESKANYYDVEDGDMAYGPQLARMLGADYSVIGVSGQGVVHNYAEEPPYDGVHTADSYEWTYYDSVYREDNPPWDTAKFPVDAIIVSIGTNDFIDRANLTEEDFKAGYDRLLTVIRNRNPGKPIICVEPLPAWVGTDARRWITDVIAEQEKNGQENLHYIAVNETEPLLTAEDYTDGETHPNKRGTAKFAAFLRQKVASVLGW